MRTPVVSRETAISIIRTTIAKSDAQVVHRLTVLDEEPRELWWAWIVPVQTVEYANIRNPKHLLLGLGPYLVDNPIQTGTGTRPHELERARGYRHWWDFRGPNRISEALGSPSAR
jgi:hypothetical protein